MHRDSTLKKEMKYKNKCKENSMRELKEKKLIQ